MAPPGRNVLCVFCGRRRPGSREHVIPRWVREKLALISEVTIEVNATAAARWPNLYVKLDRAVCSDCNNGWMSRLEDTVKPFLGPMLINERPVELDAAQQRDLARWAVIKVLLLELSIRQQHPRRRQNLGYKPSESELAWLMANQDPPPRSRVWLGAFDAQGQAAVNSQALLLSSDGSSGQDPLFSHVTTLTIGYVLLQVFSIDYVMADARALDPFNSRPAYPFDQALVQIWPIVHQVVRWPPTAYVDQTILGQVVAWARP
jgi:hypothetical protein